MNQENRQPLLGLVLYVSLTIAATLAAPIQRTTRTAIHLSQFDYLPARNLANATLLDSETGEIDEETMKVMALPQFGLELQNRWETKALTYRITKYPKHLNPQEVDAEIVKAFSVWSDHTDLTFTAKQENPVDIEIRFEENEHGDCQPFDGETFFLAHAFLPLQGGDVHFYDAVDWTIDSSLGTNLFYTAAHEIGHSLGLDHSNVESALMAPVYRVYDPEFRLDSDDIQAIQTLYGKKSHRQY